MDVSLYQTLYRMLFRCFQYDIRFIFTIHPHFRNINRHSYPLFGDSLPSDIKVTAISVWTVSRLVLASTHTLQATVSIDICALAGIFWQQNAKDL
jgi:hypothetical protein